MPTNSTAKVPGSTSGPELSFFFDQTGNVARAAVDRAAQEIDRCLSALPVGRYEGDEISRLCPYPSLKDFKQTCVVILNGYITERLADGSGYKATVNQQLMCDGVGYGRAQPTNTGWMSCYQNSYEGVATISSGQGGARLARLRSASKKALQQCSANNRSASRRVQNRMDRCAAKIIARNLRRTVK